ncbi:hypothetical protein EVAR_79041_1 [Eumeta japonica]|uniref:Uncharacterized protein n=1 Tax=Eumeta variegata TaxID=151549 RepID=A0A4C1XRW3_EUMVA|nr:hypothetical protein EVAR_79041_1 [Eumeta japonica]
MMCFPTERNQEEGTTSVQTKVEKKKAAVELYQLTEMGTENSVPSEEREEWKSGNHAKRNEIRKGDFILRGIDASVILDNSSPIVLPSPSASGKRTASSALSSDDSEVFDATIRGSDDDAKEFQLVKPRKTKNKKTRRRRVSKTNSDDMETELVPRVPINFKDLSAFIDTPQAREATAVSPAIAGANVVNNKMTGNRLTTPPKLNLLPQSFHTHPLDEECKVKAVIRSILVEFPTDEVMTDLAYQGYAVHSVHRLHRKDGTSVRLVLAVLNKANNIKDIYK